MDWIWLNIRGALTEGENRKAGNVQVENKNEKIDWIKYREGLGENIKNKGKERKDSNGDEEWLMFEKCMKRAVGRANEEGYDEAAETNIPAELRQSKNDMI